MKYSTQNHNWNWKIVFSASLAQMNFSIAFFSVRGGILSKVKLSQQKSSRLTRKKPISLILLAGEAKVQRFSHFFLSSLVTNLLASLLLLFTLGVSTVPEILERQRYMDARNRVHKDWISLLSLYETKLMFINE